MKARNFLALISVICLLGLSGCISLADTPAPRLYMLHALDKNQAVEQYSIPSDVIIAIGPIKIPEYQDRPQIVTQDKNRMLTMAQFDRWGEHLDRGMSRVILENLSLMLPGANLELFPVHYAIPLSYQVLVDVVKLENDLEKEIFFVAQWSIIDLKNKKMAFTRRAEFHQPISPASYTGLADALSAICVSLSGEIAKEVESLVKK